MIKIGLTDFTPVDKIIEIRDKSQNIKAKYAISATDIQKHTLMSEHYIEISFLYNKNIAFKRSDYILWNGERFTLREDYIPTPVNKYKYQYTLKFEATEMLFQDIQFYYLNQSLKESEWRLAGNAEYFIKIVADNANRYFGVTDFKVGVIEPSDIKDIIFGTNTNTFDALTQIAESFEAEWYMTGKTINLVKKVSFGTEVDFEPEISILSMSRSEGENSKKYTRILALGSTRNIPKDYRVSVPGESVDAIYPKRLRISAAKGDVIDAYPDMSLDEVVEGTVVFDEVYPKRVGVVEAVGTIEYTDTDEDTGEVTKWNAFKIKDSGINFKDEYVLPGEELRLIFQSGDLNGFDFALKFHKDGFSKTDNSQYFEIVRSDDYGKKMPNDTMKPKAGDKYVLYGFNIALVSDQYVLAGEQELFETASAWLQKQLQDTSVYTCSTVIDYFKKNEMDLEIGQKIKLVNDLFADGVRSSRIMGYERKLVNKYDAIYTVGDNSAYSRLAAIEKDIKELQYAGVVYESTGYGSVYLIKQFDTTTPSDHNAYSAKASDAKYFNKQTGGSIQGEALFQKNIQVLGSAISDVFQNSTFTAGQLGSGFQIKRDANGQSYMEIDNLMVRREAVFNRLTISEIKSVGGTILLSLANIVISKIEDKASTWKCFFDTADGTIPNDFAVGDQAICRKFIGHDIKYYWALVTAVGTDYIELSSIDKDGSSIPARGDEVVQLGNRNDVNRQYAIMLSAYGSAAPSIYQYAGINSYDLTGKEVTAISPKGNRFTGSFAVSTNGTTVPIYKEMGVFVNETVYYLNDRVSYLGSYWVCIVNTTITTPSEGSSTWRKETAGQTDINNAVESSRSEIESEMIILNDLIASKVSQIDFNNLNNQVTDISAQQTIQADLIQSTVAKVDNIQIGGRNFIPKSRLDSSENIAAIYFQSPTTKELYNDSVRGNVLKARANLGTTYFPKSEFTNGDVVTLTFTIRADEDQPMYTQICDGSGANRWGGDYIPVTTKWQRLSLTFIIPDNITVVSAQGLYFYLQNTTYYIADIQLEKGNKATSWSPAPEDVQGGIDALGVRVSTSESKILQQADKITSTVESVNYLQTAVVSGNLYCRGTGQNRNAPRILRINDNEIYNDFKDRGLRLTIILRSNLTVTSNENYDVYGLESERIRLARDLNNLADGVYGLPDTYLIVLTSFDAVVIDNSLADAMARCGGSGIILSFRNPYALVGIPGIGKGNGLESFQDIGESAPYAEIATRIINGMPQGIDSLVGRTFSKIEQTAEAINLTVSNIKVGGTNMVSNLPANWQQGAYQVGNGVYGYYSTYICVVNTIAVKPSTQYTVSTDSDYAVDILEFSDTTYIGYQYGNPVTLAVSSATTKLKFNVYRRSGGALTPADIVNIKLNVEEGNKATSWSPSIADAQANAVNEVKNGITINTDGVTIFGNQFKVDTNLIANAIETGNLSVGNGNFRVGQDGKISAKGATLEGSLDVVWDGNPNTPVNTISVVDKANSASQTKVIITPQNIRSISNITGSNAYPTVTVGGVFEQRSQVTQGSYSWTGNTISLPEGKKYDLIIPPIMLEAWATPPTTGNPDYSRFTMYLDNLSTGGADLIMGDGMMGAVNVATPVVINKEFIVNGLPAGNYRLRIILSITSTNFNTSSYSRFYITAGSTFTVRPIIEATEIGRNGIMSAFSADKYFHLTSDGFNIRMGSYGFRITTSGIQKSSNMANANPTWTNL